MVLLEFYADTITEDFYEGPVYLLVGRLLQHIPKDPRIYSQRLVNGHLSPMPHLSILPNLSVSTPYRHILENMSWSCAETDTNEPRHDKTSKMRVRPAKTQISLGIRQV